MLECSCSLFILSVVWMGVDGVCQILRPDGEAEKDESSRDQMKDERDGSIKVQTPRRRLTVGQAGRESGEGSLVWRLSTAGGGEGSVDRIRSSVC